MCMLLFFVLTATILFALVFIFNSKDEQYYSKLSLLVFGLSIVINILLLNQGVFKGHQNFTEFLLIFEFDIISIFDYVRTISYVSIVSLLSYFGFKAYGK